MRVLGLGVVLATGGGCGVDGPSAQADVVLISLDTTRADHIGAYGSAVRTPAIDRVAAQGIVFENVSSACTTTLPSHVSMFTGLWPTGHGVARNGYAVNDDNRMLPELLARVGYETVGVSAASELSELLHFPQGFEHWDQDSESLDGHLVDNREARDASEITDAAIAYLDSRVSQRPLFLFVHYVDPHAPYDPPDGYRSLYGAVPPGRVGSYESIRDARQRSNRVPGEPLEVDRHLARLYAGEVTCMDAQVGRLLEALRRHGLYDEALLIIVADHGETFWEHPRDLWSHGRAAYETTVEVPLILRLPQGRRGGRRVSTLVSTVDLAPTIADLLHLPFAEDLDGSSLVPVMDGEAPARPEVYSQGPLPGGRLEHDDMKWKNQLKAHSVRVGRWKLIRTPFLGEVALYDLERDPHERHNLIESDDPEVIRRRDELARKLRGWITEADPLPSEFFPRAKPTGVDHAVARHAMWERLRRLGYIEEVDERP